jgi:NADH-quinone oxidoreductase subunit M
MGLLAASAAASDQGGTSMLIPLMILVPLFGAGLIAVVPKAREELFRPIALLSSIVTGALSVYALAQFRTVESGYQFIVDRPWIEPLGISLHFGIDGISLFLVVLTGFIFPIAILGSTPHHDPKPYYGWLMLLMAGSVGVFTSLDLVLFFVFFEVVLVPMYFLIGLWGHGRRIYAATKFFLFTMFGSALMLVGIVALGVLHQKGAGGDLTFSIPLLTDHLAISDGAARWIFVSFAIAFAVKVPLFPLHTWLPDAHTEAPTAGSVILAAVMLKLGTYGFLRLGIEMFPEPSVWAAPVLMTLGVIGIVYGAIAATMQKDLKRLVAYSSVAHLGFIILGMFSLTVQGIEGGLLIMVNHGITTGALFLLVGMLYERRHTREISQLSGLQKSAPIMAAVFTTVMLASIGVPGLNGFPGEFLALLGAFVGARWWGVVAVTGVILAALYLLWAYQRVFHGPAEGENARMRDMSLSEFLVMAPLLALIVFLGVYPTPLLERMEPSVRQVVRHVEAEVDGFESPGPIGGDSVAESEEPPGGGEAHGAATDGGR